MKTIKEVSELLGITRRTLQEYDRIGLLSPTNKKEISEGKLVHWKYDDIALNRLKLISLFIEAGYKREQIKEFLNDYKKLKKEFRILEKKLEEKQKRIERLLSEVRISRVYMELPNSIADAVSSRAESFFSEKSIDRQEIIKQINENLNLNDPEVRDYFKAQTAFEGLALFDEPVDSAAVQIYIYNMLYYLMKIIAKQDGDIKDYTEEQLREEFSEGIDNKKDRGEIVDMLYAVWADLLPQIDDFYGEGKAKYMREALEYFRKHGNTWNR